MQEIIPLDCRQMEPPEPMVAVLEACSKLKRGQKIQMIHRKKPMPLFSKLEELGFTYEVEEKASDHFEIWITHQVT